MSPNARLIPLALIALTAGCTAYSTGPAPIASLEEPTAMSESHPAESEPQPVVEDQPAQATFGAGCFWCVEAVFLEVKGVTAVESGYSGGEKENPTYAEICTGTTGHAEVIRVTYEPAKVSFADLLEVFWATHDPTTLNRQGADQGTQYRSVVFYHDEDQKALAEKYKQDLDASGAWLDPIVTEISPLTNYYKAEDYHQNYYNNNPEQGYCQVVIRPKMDKFREVFKEKLKAE